MVCTSFCKEKKKKEKKKKELLKKERQVTHVDIIPFFAPLVIVDFIHVLELKSTAAVMTILWACGGGMRVC
jgi:hypothetical protein